MTTATTTSRSDSKMKSQLNEQNAEIAKLRTRISTLVDEMAVLQHELNAFKKNVSKDILDVIEAIKEGK